MVLHAAVKLLLSSPIQGLFLPSELAMPPFRVAIPAENESSYYNEVNSHPIN